VENIVERGRLQMTIWRMRIACWKPKVYKYTQVVSYSLLFPCNNGSTNASQCYVIRPLPVLFESTMGEHIHTDSMEILQDCFLP